MKRPTFIFALLAFLPGCDSEKLAASIECAPTHNHAYQCSVSNTGTVALGACFDIVAICQDGEHRQSLCSTDLSPGEKSSIVAAKLQPEFGFFSTCMGTELRHKRLIKTGQAL